MKKNKMMRISSALLVAVILTTCAISGTFAKYVTAASDVSDSARVAKWGVTVNATAADLFADSYKDTKTTYTAGETLDTITVQADTQNVDVFAPGTKGEQTGAITVTGKPEVDVEVVYSADVSFDGWTLSDGTTFYCPLIFNINGTEIKQDSTITSAAAFAAAIKAEIEGLDATYHTNTDLSAQAGNTVDISWEWPFYVSAENDVKDTDLGNQAAAGSASKVSITYSATATQID